MFAASSTACRSSGLMLTWAATKSASEPAEPIVSAAAPELIGQRLRQADHLLELRKDATRTAPPSRCRRGPSRGRLSTRARSEGFSCSIDSSRTRATPWIIAWTAPVGVAHHAQRRWPQYRWSRVSPVGWPSVPMLLREQRQHLAGAGRRLDNRLHYRLFRRRERQHQAGEEHHGPAGDRRQYLRRLYRHLSRGQCPLPSSDLRLCPAFSSSAG